MIVTTRRTAILGFVVAIVIATVTVRAQWAPRPGEWHTYGADLASTRYSPLDQINAANFSKLQLAFRIKTDNFGPRPEFQMQGTPLMVNGRLFLTAGTRRAAVAADATTGELCGVTASTKASAVRLPRANCRAEAWRTGATAKTNASST